MMLGVSTTVHEQTENVIYMVIFPKSMHLSAKYSCALFIQSTIDKLELRTIKDWCFGLPHNVSFNLVTTCSVMLWVTQMGVEGYLFNSTYVCVFILDKMTGDSSLMGTGVQISERHQVVSSDQLLLLPEPSFMHNRQMVLGQLKIPRTSLIHSYSAGGILWLIWIFTLFLSLKAVKNEDGDISERQKLFTNLELQRPKNILYWSYWYFTKLFFI